MSDKRTEAPSGVWCTRCRTNLLASEEAVTRHFVNAHKRQPDVDEVKLVLKRRQPDYPESKKAKQKKRTHPSPSGEFPDFDEIAEIEWRKYHVLIATPGSGKKR